jgi:hypothetical protein
MDINQIIPLDDYQHRNGFSNDYLIDVLDDEEIFKLESELIRMIKKKSDMLVVETLGYIKSKRSLPTLYELLEKSQEEMMRIIIAVSIFEINQDKKMIEITRSSFKEIKDKYQLISAFYYIVKFQDSDITQLILEYTTNSDYLIAYNAKQVLKNCNT